MPSFIDMTGQRIGLWTVIEQGPNNASNAIRWLCRCDCGTTKLVTGQTLRNGSSKSCGCESARLAGIRIANINGRHFLSHSRTHNIWSMMKTRCLNKTNRAYPRYGGRGITVCDEWLTFDNFLRDMGECPSTRHTLDRIDNNSGYSPDNCRWADWKTQQNNRSSNRLFSYKNETLTISQWAERTGINRRTITQRINKGWSSDKIFTPPFDGRT